MKTRIFKLDLFTSIAWGWYRHRCGVHALRHLPRGRHILILLLCCRRRPLLQRLRDTHGTTQPSRQHRQLEYNSSHCNNPRFFCAEKETFLQRLQEPQTVVNTRSPEKRKNRVYCEAPKTEMVATPRRYRGNRKRRWEWKWENAPG